MRNHTSFMLFLIFLLVSTMAFANGDQENNSGMSPDEVTLSFWTFQEIHYQYFSKMVDRWNAEGHKPMIKIDGQVLPYGEMHDKLLVALQSGVGAPDMVDIEISRFPNYLKGKVQLLPFNDMIDPVKDKLVIARYDNYAKDGMYYGLPFHVGASVMYYNKELLDAAGVKVSDIVTWDDYFAAGRKVLSATGKPMTTFEVTEQWSFWQMISQQGSDLFNADGTPSLDNPTNVKTLQFMLDMINSGVAVPAPGGFHHSEEYYGFMNDAGAASVMMPMWYMGRFTDYMPDLNQKIIIAPLPRWTKDGNRSAGMGGTSTNVTAQSKYPDVAKQFLAFAKLSQEGNIAMWKDLGFDPPRWDVWEKPEMNEPNKFTAYFLNDNIFEMLVDIKDEVYPINVVEDLPEGITLVRNALFQVLEEQSKTPKEALSDVAKELR
ncbi:ABC transporter substrate-binding protein [Spirochaeta cellobiosiphila]|uniref:ABC transporter substrate-binding protein n=1 Tax=Spirochaeta cellobiosiphila TaxID=504483 RepID=UPI000417B9C6|nr:sugar ABC transporter substrate-binding protein [Spirochaeta cellobiosiphila]